MPIIGKLADNRCTSSYISMNSFNMCGCLSCPAVDSRSAVCALLLCYYFFNNSCYSNYLKIYLTDLCPIFRVGRTMAVDTHTRLTALFQDYLGEPPPER